MNIDLPFILVFLVALTGLIAVADILFFAQKRRMRAGARMPWAVDYARSLFPVLLLVLVLRSFVVQIFKVPSGSLEPTVMPGDFMAVNMYDYGLRLPVWHKKLVSIHSLKRGDIALFYWPVNPKVNFVKRVVGLPGDRISYINKVFYINGQEAKQESVSDAYDSDGAIGRWPVKVRSENLLGVEHKIYVRDEAPAQNFYDLVVPADHYLMIGDNRDSSNDSRGWGFVPDDHIIGKAAIILFNWQNWLTIPHWRGQWV